jgi:hypothetical protein
VSHFRPWRDSAHGILLHMRLLVLKHVQRFRVNARSSQ